MRRTLLEFLKMPWNCRAMAAAVAAAVGDIPVPVAMAFEEKQ